MTSLIFIATIFSVFLLIIRIFYLLIINKKTNSTYRYLAIILFSYCFLWVIFYYKSREIIVPLGTDVCFDDWCATISKIEKLHSIGAVNTSGQFIILYIRMSNHARGIAQKPSEPRIHIIDENNKVWTFSKAAQETYEKLIGKQVSLDEKLELNESKETCLVFELPENNKKLRAVIKEGPFITYFLFKDDQEVFVVK